MQYLLPTIGVPPSVYRPQKLERYPFFSLTRLNIHIGFNFLFCFSRFRYLVRQYLRGRISIPTHQFLGCRHIL